MARASNGFTLIEMSIALAIVAILAAVALFTVDTESGDASVVRTTQGAMQAAIVSIAASTRSQVLDTDVIDSASNVVMKDYDSAGVSISCGGTTECTLTLPSGRSAKYGMALPSGFTLLSVDGFSNYSVVGGELN